MPDFYDTIDLFSSYILDKDDCSIQPDHVVMDAARMSGCVSYTPKVADRCNACTLY